MIEKRRVQSALHTKDDQQESLQQESLQQESLQQESLQESLQSKVDVVCLSLLL